DLTAWGASLALAALLLVHSLRALFASAPPRRAPVRIDPPARDRPIAQKRLARSAAGRLPPTFPARPAPTHRRREAAHPGGDARAKLGEVILRADVRYLLDRDGVAVDLDLFERLLAEADAAPSVDRQALLGQALALVRGQPLAGSDYPWAVGEIRHLRAMIV